MCPVRVSAAATSRDEGERTETGCGELAHGLVVEGEIAC